MYVQRVYNIKVILDKSLIKVGEVKEDLDVLIGFRFKPFLNSFYVVKVHYNTIRGNDKA